MKASEGRRSTRTKTMTDFFQKRQQPGARKRGTVSDNDSDEDSNNSDDNDDNDNSTEDDDSENEFSLTSLPNRSDVCTSTNKKKPTKGKKKSSSNNKRRRLGTEITMDISSQLLEQVSEINNDTSIYDQALAEDSDVEQLVKTWVENYDQDKVMALQELINYVIRCSGCKMAVTTEAFESEELTLSALNELQTELAKLPYHDYPIISKGSLYRSLKKNLLDFFQTLIQECQSARLYDGTLMETLQSWLTTMSSSAYRPFRHTSTLIAFKVTETLCTLADTTVSEITTHTRQKKITKVVSQRINRLEKKLTDLNEYISDFFGSVFTHRFRDVEYVIRSECVKELCGWTRLHATLFASNEYLRHFGWALNDTNANVRIESLKAITKLYKTEKVRGNMVTFMQRFVARIEEMARYDVDVSVRIHAIGLCNTLYTSNKDLITAATHDAMIHLVTSSNPRIRKSVAPFVKSVILNDLVKPSMDQVEESLAALSVASSTSDSTRPRRASAAAASAAMVTEVNKPTVNKTWVLFKSMAGFLASRLDDMEDDVSAIFDQRAIQTIGNTVDALWGQLQDLNNYQAMADYLGRDHSSTQAGQLNGDEDNEMQEGADSAELESCYQLTGMEETVLVYVFVICLTKLAGEKKKDQPDETRNKITEHLIQVLPKLFRKYGGDINRLTQLVQVPQLLNMNISSIHRMMKASIVFETNADLVDNLQEKVVDQFREACHGKDLCTARLTPDDVNTITTAAIRLDYLIGVTDVTAAMDDVSDLKADVTEIIGELVDRSLLGYEGENQIGQSSLSILFQYLVWRCFSVVEDSMGMVDTAVLAKIEKRRNWTIEKCLELISTNADIAPHPEVQRLAFGTLVDTYTLFSNDKFLKSDLEQLYLKCDESTQEQLVTFFLSKTKALMDAITDDDDEDDTNDVANNEERIADLFGILAHGLVMNVIDLKHGTLLLEHYGEHGDYAEATVDSPVKVFVDELETNLIGNGTFADQICDLYMATLKKSFELHVDTNYRSTDKPLKLGRLLSQTFKQDANHSRLTDNICDRIHLDGIDYSLTKAHDATIDDAALSVALKFFKILTLFAKQLSRARDIGKIHKHLEKRLQEYQLKPVDGAKEWEPYFAYVKTMDDLLKKKGFRYDHTVVN
ncbi:hypothetical protein [Absidia glauca]|uniref:SCD domain-containing protein n=1 Tax=Absidia glauca TaxID=4829 RepID=A0A163M626_ABSGL|nr:hypothetical protein [Absidia glauca]